jgi:hypothetical protein
MARDIFQAGSALPRIPIVWYRGAGAAFECLRGFVCPCSPRVVNLRADLSVLEAVETVRHELRHAEQMAEHGTDWTGEQRLAFEAEATAYGREFARRWAAQGPEGMLRQARGHYGS